ncbi:hypothetical protein U27_01218 [Candidatus Vecturithrix granuli]|uniref:CHAT domain-containing protein n=1 Tax=Vecturithrix granuli TaxID=1499967 RepID=A0A081C9R3_VECG1|nr:hypothetical protein U27_01218 [Candidatus Vecturithrix granuli]
MKHHIWRRNILYGLGLLSLLLYGSMTIAAQWYEYYLEAQHAAAVGEWDKAIELFEKAIDQEPTPEKGKRTYGTQRIDYYPYLELGQAYLNAGDLVNACRVCEKSWEYGIAPEDEIAACLQKACAPMMEERPGSRPMPEPQLPMIPLPVAPSEATPTPQVFYSVVEEVEITRYPTMETQEQVVPGQEFTVQVSLTEEQITPDVTIAQGKTTEAGELALSLPALDQWEIEIALFGEGFQFRNNQNTGKITLPQEGDSTPALFYLTAQPISEAQRVRKLYATLWYQGKYLAKIQREILVVQSPAAMETETQTPASASLTTTQGQAATVVPYDMFLPPDLTVYIVTAPDPAASQTSWITISSPFLQLTLDTFSTPAGMEDWLSMHYTKISQAGRGLTLLGTSAIRETQPTPAPIEKERRLALLKGLGRELYQKFAPPAFKNAFWTLKDKLGDEFDSIQIFTNDPTLPWELMRPVRPNDSDEQDFLGITFCIARWHVSQGVMPLESPPPQIPLETLFVISPEYTGDMALPGVTVELEALQQMEGFQHVNGRFEALQSLFAGAKLKPGIIHYAGHGMVEENIPDVKDYAMYLEDGSLDVMTWRGLVSGRKLSDDQAYPLFFFNACDLGQASYIANFVDGWAPAVLESGASGYIGGLWPLSDQGAAAFAVRFYELLTENLAWGSVNVADILRQTRAQVYEYGDPTFLAYVYYGYPNFLLLAPDEGLDLSSSVELF